MSGDFDPYHKWLGIPPEDQPPDHYRLLGVTRFETDAEVIENAAAGRLAAIERHLEGDYAAEAAELTERVNAARFCLTRPKRKKGYDAALRQMAAQRPATRTVQSPTQPVQSPTQPKPVEKPSLPPVPPPLPETAKVDEAPSPEPAWQDPKPARKEVKPTLEGATNLPAAAFEFGGNDVGESPIRRGSARPKSAVAKGRGKRKNYVGQLAMIVLLLMLAVGIAVYWQAKSRFESPPAASQLADTVENKQVSQPPAEGDAARRGTDGPVVAVNKPLPGDGAQLRNAARPPGAVQKAEEASHLTAADFNAAFEVFKDPTTTEKQLIDATRLLQANLRHPAMPREIRAKAWVLQEATDAVNRVHVINERLIPYLEGFRVGRRDLDWGDQAQVHELAKGGAFDFRRAIPAEGKFVHYPGLNEVLWRNLDRYLPEAIELMQTGERARANQRPRAVAAGSDEEDKTAEWGTGDGDGGGEEAPRPRDEGADEPQDEDPDVVFVAGDGESQARAYLRALGLEESRGFWIRPVEAEIRRAIERAQDAYANYNRAHHQVEQNQKLVPKLDALERRLRQELASVERLIERTAFSGTRRTRRELVQRQERLIRQIEEQVVARRLQFEADEQHKAEADEACRAQFEEVLDAMQRLKNKYRRIEARVGTKAALEAVQGQLGPSRLLQSKFSRMEKDRTEFQAKAR
ncbi:MAG: hypothetical protein DWQ35_00275 [Planctomycetota bacterium]|nr:MAG: hypothetical protein DWQ35_00275 [Planctomycetota bacterium]REK27643.1 MAG: hypothetical protein DWQ42_06675 [Planctomycetota bacterium]